VCTVWQEEVQDALRRHSAAGGAAGRRAETGRAETHRQGA